jgi:hypothetical protein
MNTGNLGLSIAMRAIEWASVPQGWKDSVLDKCAHVAAGWCDKHGIPARLLAKYNVDQGEWGITGHGIIQPIDRTDPGPLFPWGEFMERVQDKLNPSSEPTEEEEDMLTRIFTDNKMWFGSFNGKLYRLHWDEVVEAQTKSVPTTALSTEDLNRVLDDWGRRG